MHARLCRVALGWALAGGIAAGGAEHATSVAGRACALFVSDAHAGVLDDAASAGARSSAAVASGVPVRITTRVDPAAVTIGTRFRYTMRVEAAAGVEVALPVIADRIGAFSIVDFGKTEKAAAPGAPAAVESWYDLVGYETGVQSVPGLPVAYRAPGAEPQQLAAPATPVEITSLLAQGGVPADVPDIKEAVPVREPGYPPWVIGCATGGAVLLLAAAYALLTRRRRINAPPPRQLHEIALEALERLRTERLVERGLFEEYYVKLSALVREYVEARFGLRAPEMTTDEFLAAAQRSREVASVHRLALQDFLSEADLVKFARHVPSPDRAGRAWSAARDFVDATRPPEAGSAAA
jgi:hypothetical protein